MDLDEMEEKMSTMEDFLSFLKMLIEDFRENQDEWQNIFLSHYLEAIHAWMESIGDDPTYFIMDEADKDNIILNKTTLRAFARTLLAAKAFGNTREREEN